MKWLSGILEVSIGPVGGRSIDFHGVWKMIVLAALVALGVTLAWLVYRYIGPGFAKMTDHELLQLIVIILTMIYLKRS